MAWIPMGKHAKNLRYNVKYKMQSKDSDPDNEERENESHYF